MQKDDDFILNPVLGNTTHDNTRNTHAEPNNTRQHAVMYIYNLQVELMSVPLKHK